MKVLVVKLSSFGDVIHALPAVSDAARLVPDIAIDWVVEEPFADIPARHPAIDRTIPAAIRRWRRHPGSVRQDMRSFLHALRARRYDLVIDAQGLVKSALVTCMARGPSAGLAWGSAREPVASLAYRSKIALPPDLHAIDKLRRLFAAALGYDMAEASLDYGLSGAANRGSKQILLLHGTTWPSKHWPEACWTRVAERASQAGYEVLLPHGDDGELASASRIAAAAGGVTILERMSIGSLVDVVAASAGAIAVDSGLGHLAVALGVPTVAIYGPTDPRLTGPRGANQETLASDHLPCIPCLARTCRLPRESGVYPPCFAPLDPETVWRTLVTRMAKGGEVTA